MPIVLFPIADCRLPIASARYRCRRSFDPRSFYFQLPIAKFPTADCRLFVPATCAAALSVHNRFISNCRLPTADYRLPDFLCPLPVPKVFQSAIGNRQLAIPYIASP
jgi:hypothetical protein